ncbi:unnamed protein product [Parajaminaea phylloscopi]
MSAHGRPGQAQGSTDVVSLRGQRVLDEDSYVSSLSALIQRDFFPGLPRLTAENEYLAALEALDDGQEGADQRLRRAEVQLDRIDAHDDFARHTARKRRHASRRGQSATPSTLPPATPHETPSRPLNRAWDPTPVRGDPVGHSPSRGNRSRPTTDRADGAVDITRHSISSFQSNYTSEDNAAFLDLLQHGNERNRQRQSWAFDKEQSNNRRRAFILSEGSKRADEGYARSLLALSDGRRRKLIADGKLTRPMQVRLRELEALQAQDEGRLVTSGVSNGAHGPFRRLIRSASEEPSASGSDPFLPDTVRARSTSPAPQVPKPLKHSLDPTSEILLPETEPPAASSARATADDPDSVLRAQRARPAAATAAGWNYSARNALFFGPDANVSTLDKASSSLPEDDRPSRAARSTAERLFYARNLTKSQTNLHNTALPSQNLFPQALYGSSGRGARGSEAGSSTGRTMGSSRIASAIGGGSDYGDHFDESGVDLREGPKVNGYGFVTPYQSPAPSARGDPDETPGTKQRVLRSMGAGGRGSTPGVFAVPPTPRRDQIAHALASKKPAPLLSKQSRVLPSARRQSKIGRGSGMLSPAARSLLSRSTKAGPASASSPAGSGARPSRSNLSATSGAGIPARGWDDESPRTRTGGQL